MKQRPTYILPVIVFAQFAGTSLCFAGNAVAGDLQKAFHLQSDAIGNITSAVQLGFIFGTLVFAILSIADRFSPSKVFLFSALAGAFFNACVYWLADGLTMLLVLRFLTGFFLAGIYPVGMKISADWFEKGLGKALGYLVGALVLGTAFPHLLKAFSGSLPWGIILLATSSLSVLGGLLLYFAVGDGPNRKPAPKFAWNAIPKIFAFKDFRSAAFGYFGHMWELYAMWAFIPIIFSTYNKMQQADIHVSLWIMVIYYHSNGQFGLSDRWVYFAEKRQSKSGVCDAAYLWHYLPYFPAIILFTKMAFFNGINYLGIFRGRRQSTIFNYNSTDCSENLCGHCTYYYELYWLCTHHF